MKKSSIMLICSSVIFSTALFAGQPASQEAKIYTSNCALCHGVKGEGVVRPTSKIEKVIRKIKGVGTVIIYPVNYYGPPLNKMSESEIVVKLMFFEKKCNYKNHPVHSLMASCIKEAKSKKAGNSIKKMAAYISKILGSTR